MFTCKFCNQQRATNSSNIVHEQLCSKNPDRRKTPFQSIEFQKNKPGGTQNGYTKAKREGRTHLISDKTRAKFSANSKKNWEKNRLRITENIRNTVNEKVKRGEWHTSVAKKMNIDYRGVRLHGKWELFYAQWLDKNCIEWTRNTKGFPYNYKGKQRTYFPDFYLPKEDEYVEIKGYETELDRAKWSQFPLKLRVIKQPDLEKIGLKVV